MPAMNASLDARVGDALRVVRARTPLVPRIGVVLGSGLGAFTDALSGATKIPFEDVPHMSRALVPGHAGALCLGHVDAAPVACLSGRLHLYEGHDVRDAVFGVRLLAALGCRAVLLTNAAGGIREGLVPGSFLLITDHLNLTGTESLIGAREPFVDMSHTYDAQLCTAARRAAAETSVRLHEGVYAGLLGPSYETPAEIRMLRTLGADAVGMSTVNEAIALRHAGVRVGAVSCVTNLAAGLSPVSLDHRDVEATAARARHEFVALLRRFTVLAAEAVSVVGE